MTKQSETTERILSNVYNVISIQHSTQGHEQGTNTTEEEGKEGAGVAGVSVTGGGDTTFKKRSQEEGDVLEATVNDLLKCLRYSIV